MENHFQFPGFGQVTLLETAEGTDTHVINYQGSKWEMKWTICCVGTFFRVRQVDDEEYEDFDYC